LKSDGISPPLYREKLESDCFASFFRKIFQIIKTGTNEFNEFDNINILIFYQCIYIKFFSTAFKTTLFPGF